MMLFSHCDKTSKRIYIAGGKPNEAEKFITKMKSLTPGLLICGSCHGYLSDDEIISNIKSAKPDFVFLGLGRIRQEKVASTLHAEMDALIFTCGAFISQTVNSKGVAYYPKIVEKLQIRWFYRWFNERGAFYRTLRYYPVFLFYFIYDFVRYSLSKQSIHG